MLEASLNTVLGTLTGHVGMFFIEPGTRPRASERESHAYICLDLCLRKIFSFAFCDRHILILKVGALLV